MKSVNKFIKKSINKRRKSVIKKDLFLPVNHTSSDVYLVSYPKSGNTWLRYLVSNLLTEIYPLGVYTNWFTIQHIIPDVQVDQNIDADSLVKKNLGYRILKSHSAYHPKYKRVVLLIRNPYDTLNSAYRYYRLNGIIPKDCSYSTFIRDSEYGASAWNKHTVGWLSHYNPGSILRIIRYEDLVQNTENTLKELCLLLGMQFDQNHIEDAMLKSTKDKMRESEKKHRSIVAIRTQEAGFVGEGNKTRKKENLNEADRSYLQEVLREGAELAGYEL